MGDRIGPGSKNFMAGSRNNLGTGYLMLDAEKGCGNALFVQANSSKLKAQSLWIRSIILGRVAGYGLRVAGCEGMGIGQSA